jgi:hypothetical protein
MEAKPRCRCERFKLKGICWHTGEHPTFREADPAIGNRHAEGRHADAEALAKLRGLRG